MNIYITGATGYVGSNLIPQLKNQNHKITCLLRSPEKYDGNTPFDKCKLIKGDITDKDSLRNTMNGADVVIHLAVSTPLTNLNNDISIYQQTNVFGTQNILEECRIASPKRIILFSSTAAIGSPQVELIDENTQQNPVNDYGRSKKDADELSLFYFREYGLPIITICFPHVYGPGEFHDLLKIIKMIKKGVLPQIGLRPNLLPMVYVSDAINAILLTLNHGFSGQKYIIADEDPHDIRLLRKHVGTVIGKHIQFYPIIPKSFGLAGAFIIEKISQAAGIKPPVRLENIRFITAGRRLSIEKAKSELGFVPEIDFQEGIRRTVACYQENGLI